MTIPLIRVVHTDIDIDTIDDTFAVSKSVSIIYFHVEVSEAVSTKLLWPFFPDTIYIITITFEQTKMFTLHASHLIFVFSNIDPMKGPSINSLSLFR